MIVKIGLSLKRLLVKSSKLQGHRNGLLLKKSAVSSKDSWQVTDEHKRML